MADLTVADELAIRRSLAAYCQHLDDGDFAGLAHQFTEDGRYEYGAETVQGRTELEAWFAGMNPPERRGKHLTVNVVVDVDGDRASVWSDFLFVRLVEGVLTPIFAGRYRDEFVRAEGRWEIRHRVATPLA